MKQVEVFLVPQPGAKPEFLASLQPVDPSPAALQTWQALPSKLVLEGYTRDAWAWKPSSSFPSMRVKSVDGRNKIDGFVKYLSERQKSAFGRFGAGVAVVSYVQTKKEPSRMDLRIAPDMKAVAGCTLKPQTVKPAVAARPPPAAATVSAAPRKPGGLLGKLVGAQQRTNQHMMVTSKPKAVLPTSSAGGGAQVGATSAPLRTSAEVLSEFRQDMADKMLDFDIQDDEVLKLTVNLADHQAGLSVEDKTKVTMEILKYMVYEAAEEVNEEWIAYKEPSEFMDEAHFSIYKEGAAPEEVLEEINKGEMPDEVRAQQRAIAEERQRQVNQAESRNQRKVMEAAHQAYEDEEEDFEALNKQKRDRRTIEDYERERSKKARTS